MFACLVDSQKLTSFFVVFGIGIFLDGKGEGRESCFFLTRQNYILNRRIVIRVFLKKDTDFDT